MCFLILLGKTVASGRQERHPEEVGKVVGTPGNVVPFRQGTQSEEDSSFNQTTIQSKIADQSKFNAAYLSNSQQ